MSGFSAEHATFVIERSLPGRPRHAYRFWAEADLKRSWTSCHPDWQTIEQSMDFKTGGAEVSRLRSPDGTIHAMRAHYLDIVEGRRIVYAYEMSAGGSRISASLVTVEFAASGAGTLMTFTEQAVFLDGMATAEGRQQGTETGFDRLALELERSVSAMQ